MFLFAFRCPSRASGHRGRDGKRSSGKIHIHSRCCRGAFPESPSQGFGETYSSVASSATLRSSFPYVCRGNIFMATAIDGGSAETRTRDLQRWQGSSEGVSPRFQQHRSTPDRTAWCTRDGSVQQMAGCALHRFFITRMIHGESACRMISLYPSVFLMFTRSLSERICPQFS